ncbi:MAG: YciC family protein, partial [Candidatus Caenarcaniphilales bacterium]|nr:YciC family protein [Candidatus Caenarcaniphilales bacterium]
PNPLVIGLSYIWGLALIQGIYTVILDLSIDGRSSLEKLIPTDFILILKLVGAAFLFGLITGIGYLFLVVPGIYLTFRLQYSLFLIADQNCGIIESFKKSWQITAGNVGKIALSLLAVFGIAVLVSIVMLVVLVPIAMLTKALGIIAFVLIGFVQTFFYGLLLIFGTLVNAEIYKKLI